MHARVRAGRELPGDVRVTLVTSLVANKMGPGNLRWGEDGPVKARTGDEKERTGTASAGGRRVPKIIGYSVVSLKIPGHGL